ncbi:MAG TPA: acetoacetate decarboxylase family protein [Terriglobia bacterium]|nr:acetoacetate decarboxylase family protein [Terriglobia bacterium]
MAIPKRVLAASGRYSLVDGIPFKLPISCEQSPVLMAAFPINAEKAAVLLPGNEIFPLRVWNRGLLVITVVDYRVTIIGKYIEYSIAIACTHGAKPAPRLLPALFMKAYDTGQYVYDLPVSTEISVKGGKGIWGMPKHQANLDFIIGDRTVSAQYDCDGQLAMRIEIARPKRTWLPINLGAINFCEFRGMLFKSYIYFRGEVGMELFKKAKATLTLGDHPRVRALKDLEIDPKPVFTAFIAEARGDLDDHCESWFMSYSQPPTVGPEGMESVVNLGLSEKWLAPPKDHP